jgi:Amt family ammonium transporter
VLIQIYAVLATIIWDAIATFVILKIVDIIVGLRVSEDVERESLDLRLHGETVV